MPSSTNLVSSRTRKGYRLDDEGVTDSWNSTSGNYRTADQMKSDGDDRREEIEFSKPNAEAVSFVFQNQCLICLRRAGVIRLNGVLLLLIYHR